MRIGSLVFLPGSSQFNGKSSSSGFIIEKGLESVKSRNYKEDCSDRKFGKKHYVFWSIIWLFSVLLWGMSLFSDQDTSFWMGFASLFVAAALFGYTSLILTKLLFFSEFVGKDLVEYHACEHKVIALLSDGKLELIIENLKKMPRVTSACGTMILAPVGILPSGICLHNAVIGWLWRFQAPLPVIFGEILLFIILMVISPFLIQFFCTTAEPSREKLEEALEVAKEFKEFYE